MIQDILNKAALHLTRAKQAQNEIRLWRTPLNAATFEDFEKLKTIDTFIYRFIKLQDMMGDKLFKILLDEIGEYKETMSLLDVLDRLEKLGLINKSEIWMHYRKLRNKLTHEYPNNEEEIAEGIGLAIEAFDEIEGIFQAIREYVKVRGIG